MVERFDDEHPSALGRDEAIALRVEGTARALGWIVVGRECFHHLERREAELGEPRFGAAGDHDVGAPAADHLERFAHGVGGRCARGRDGGVVALRAVAHRNLRRRHVREHLHHVEGVDAVAAFIDDVLHRFVGIRIATHAVAEHHADAIRVDARDVKLRLRERFLRCGERKLREARHPSRLFAVDEVFRHEVLHFARDVRVVALRVDLRQPADTGASCDGALPELVDRVTERVERAHTGDDDAAASVVAVLHVFRLR